MVEEDCALLRQERVAAWAAAAGGSKARYFESLQRGTAPHNLSRTRRVQPRRRDVLNTTVRLAFVGDSVMRELSLAWHAVAPRSMAQYVYAERSNLTSPAVQAALQAVRADCALDGIFVGSAALHSLYRGSMEGARERASSPANPYEQHAAPTRAVVATLSDVARAAMRPIVYVGTMPVDVATLLLHPPKRDWDSFHDFYLAELWAASERDIERSERASLDAHLAFLHPSSLVAQCPGVRCDGMHFNAEYPVFGCASSLGLWYDFIVSWMRDSRVLERAEAAQARRRQQCDGPDMKCTDKSTGTSGARLPLPWRAVGSTHINKAHALGLTLGNHCYDERALPIEQMRPWNARKYAPDEDELSRKG